MSKNFKIFSFIMLLFSASFSYADDASETCQRVSTYAEIIMKNRQNNVPLSEMMDAVDGVSDKGARDFTRRMVMMAYDGKRHEDPAEQAKIIEGFKKGFGIMCQRETQREKPKK